MGMINENFSKLPGRYLFTETAERAKKWTEQHPGERLIRLGVGDTTLPISSAAAEAMSLAALELATVNGYRGYGPEEGYEFLRQVIERKDYRERGIDIDATEIFISDGAKSDCGGIMNLFSKTCSVALCDPVYPAYADALAILGRAGEYDVETGYWTELTYLPCNEGNGFVPEPPKSKVDVVYLCFPNNPTGAIATREQLVRWVNWANETGAVIVFDGAYEAYIADEDVPHSIFEIEGAKTCAIEIRSLSKTAGFTGVRCAYTVIPHSLKRDGVCLNLLWRRRQAARFNGVSYVVQRGAEAIYRQPGEMQTKACIEYYRKNARVMRNGLLEAGLTVYGGENAPYIWVKTPKGVDSWTFFEMLLEKCGVLTTPGIGFGACGEGFLRLTAFGKFEEITCAICRIKDIMA